MAQTEKKRYIIVSTQMWGLLTRFWLIYHELVGPTRTKPEVVFINRKNVTAQSELEAHLSNSSKIPNSVIAEARTSDEREQILYIVQQNPVPLRLVSSDASLENGLPEGIEFLRKYGLDLTLLAHAVVRGIAYPKNNEVSTQKS